MCPREGVYSAQSLANRGPSLHRAAGIGSGTTRGTKLSGDFTSLTFTRESWCMKKSLASAIRGARTSRSEWVFHQKFGYRLIAEFGGNKVEIDFASAGWKRVMDSFVTGGVADKSA